MQNATAVCGRRLLGSRRKKHKHKKQAETQAGKSKERQRLRRPQAARKKSACNLQLQTGQLRTKKRSGTAQLVGTPVRSRLYFVDDLTYKTTQIPERERGQLHSSQHCCVPDNRLRKRKSGPRRGPSSSNPLFVCETQGTKTFLQTSRNLKRTAPLQGHTSTAASLPRNYTGPFNLRPQLLRYTGGRGRVKKKKKRRQAIRS